MRARTAHRDAHRVGRAGLPAPGEITELPGGLLETVTAAFGSADAVTTRTEYFGSDDELGRIGLVKTVTEAAGTPLESFVEYDYDLNRNLAHAWDESRNRTDYEYDDLNRLSKVTLPDPGTGQHGRPVTKYEYDGMGNPRFMRVLKDGQFVETEYQYDALNRLWKEVLPAPGGAKDTNGNYLGDQTRAVTEYRYDSNGNLEYTLEPGNRETKSVYDARNLLVAAFLPDPMRGFTAAANMPNESRQRPVIRYEYDALGNVKSQSDPRDMADQQGGKVRAQYWYDELGRSTKVMSPDDPKDNCGAPATNYEYWSDGKLKEVRAPGPNKWSGNANVDDAVTNYVYDGLGRLLREAQPADAQNKRLVTEYAYDLRDPTVASQHVIWTLTDRQGSVEAAYCGTWTGSTGKHFELMKYEAFGRPALATMGLESTLSCDIEEFNAGRAYDWVSKLYVNGARWYDSAMQRFISQDPIGFAGGDTNLYRYCGNSPINYTDPSGCVVNVAAAGVGAIVGGIFGGVYYGYQCMTGAQQFNGWDLAAYIGGGAAAGGVAGLTFGASLAVAGSWGLGTVASTAVAGGVSGTLAGATGGMIVGAGTTANAAWNGRAAWGDVAWNGLAGAGRGALYGGVAGTVGGAAFPIVASLTTGGIMGGFIAGSTSAMLGDVAGQGVSIGFGLQNGYDPGMTAFAGIGGGILGGYAGYRDPRLSGLVGSRAWREPIDAVAHPIATARAIARSYGSTRGSVSGYAEIMRKVRAARGGDRDAAAEIAAAKFLREKGVNVHFQNPDGWPSGYHGATADLRIGGIRGNGAYGTPYDVYSPVTRNPNAIFREIRNKNHQAQGVILDLSGTSVAPGDLGNLMARLWGAGARNIKDIMFLP